MSWVDDVMWEKVGVANKSENLFKLLSEKVCMREFVAQHTKDAERVEVATQSHTIHNFPEMKLNEFM